MLQITVDFVHLRYELQSEKERERVSFNSFKLQIAERVLVFRESHVFRLKQWNSVRLRYSTKSKKIAVSMDKCIGIMHCDDALQSHYILLDIPPHIPSHIPPLHTI